MNEEAIALRTIADTGHVEHRKGLMTRGGCSLYYRLSVAGSKSQSGRYRHGSLTTCNELVRDRRFYRPVEEIISPTTTQGKIASGSLLS